MELNQYSLLEESPKIDENMTLYPNQNFDPSLSQLISTPEFSNHCLFGPFPDDYGLTLPELTSFYDIQAAHDLENIEFGFMDYSAINGSFIVDGVEADSANMEIGNVDLCGQRTTSSVKKPKGQPSKNLMAERRRRKRLNDRLSMLRSIVPKISKMDRTSILGDTIDYTRELLDKIHKLREQGADDDNLNQIRFIGNYFKVLKPNEIPVRNPSKFDVERRDHDTQVEVLCTVKPGLLISTLNTLEALDLDIHQCLISCFNEFSLQASCYEVAEHRSLVSCEDVKQALYKNAGFGGRCP